MNIKKVTAVYFSPTGNAKKIATIITDRIGRCMQIPVVYDDFTLPEFRTEVREYGPEELVVFVVPIYAGRVPNKILPSVQTLFKGNHTCALPVVTFGNRSFDNGLKELCMELERSGFLLIGTGAVVSEHSFSNRLAGGRPDEKDCHELQHFANQIIEKLLFSGAISKGPKKNTDVCPLDYTGLFIDVDDVPGQWPLEKYYTPLGVDGKPAVFLKAKPKTKVDACNDCGICAQNCPMGSIDINNPHQVSGICIKCQACIRKCPQNARFFDDEAFLSHVKMLEENYERPAKSFFVV